MVRLGQETVSGLEGKQDCELEIEMGPRWARDTTYILRETGEADLEKKNKSYMCIKQINNINS